MKWARRIFAPPERKSAWPGAAFAGFAAGGVAGQDPPASYAARAAAAMRDATGYRAIRLVSEGLAGVSLHVGGEDHAALALVGPALLEAVAVHLLLHGNAFVQTGLDLRDMPGALWALRPERVQVETDGDGAIRCFSYRVNGRVARLAAEGSRSEPGLLHIRAFDPLDDHLGAGALAAAAGPVALLEAAGRWNRALLANAARPSGALVLDGEEGPLSPEQFARLREEVEAGFQGAMNAGRPMLLGLPGDSTHANYAEANVALWRLTILPMLERILAGISGHLAMWWPGLRIEVDLDRIPALWADREKLWRHVGDAAFLSDAEKREMLGWAPKEG